MASRGMRHSGTKNPALKRAAAARAGRTSEAGRVAVALLTAAGLAALVAGCAGSLFGEAQPEPATPEQAQAMQTARAIFGVLPASAANPKNPPSEAKHALGKQLYFEPRLSKNHDVSCNSCHMLDAFGVDARPTSPGHKKQLGGRNSPTTLNAALHFRQFWDGRAADVEEQAKGPVLNPVEMAMVDEAAIEAVLDSIPGYAPLFSAAFPNDPDPVSFDNAALAIGAFERLLLTPAPFDAWMQGDASALDERQQRGMQTFVATGCPTCHSGNLLGGRMYQKLGLVNQYETTDLGRAEVTGEASDRFFFKVPSLRNVAKTGPYFHDGSIASLREAVRLMAWHQLGQQLDRAKVDDIVVFLESLTGELPAELANKPELPESGPNTPAPDPS